MDKLFRLLLILSCLSCCGLQGVIAQQTAPSPQADTLPAPIGILPTEGFNLSMIDQPVPGRVVVGLTPPAHNWFAGTLTHLPLDRDTTIGLSMAGNDSKGNVGDVRKWDGLRPVMTYADPTKYDAYQWYHKNAQGHWMLEDPVPMAAAQDAGTGPVPIQHAIPPALAAQFLSDDGQYWLPWREIDTVEVLPQLNIFRMTQRFSSPTATVAMRIPCLYSFLHAYADRLEQAHLPGVTVETIGTTPEGRALQVIRLDDPGATLKPAERKTVLVIAREHTTEHASSWAVLGMIKALLAATPDARALRKETTWLFIPLEDPDGSAHVQFDHMTDRFMLGNGETSPPEVFAYARYMTDYVYAGRPIDVAISLHNVEANEGEHLISPFADKRFLSTVLTVNHLIFDAVRQHGFQTSNPDVPWDQGFATFRLYGWVALSFGTLDLAFEVNDRYPKSRLILPRIFDLGGAMVAPISTWCASADGQRWHLRVRKLLTVKALERTIYFERVGYPPAQRTLMDLLLRAY